MYVKAAHGPLVKLTPDLVCECAYRAPMMISIITRVVLLSEHWADSENFFNLKDICSRAIVVLDFIIFTKGIQDFEKALFAHV